MKQSRILICTISIFLIGILAPVILADIRDGLYSQYSYDVYGQPYLKKTYNIVDSTLAYTTFISIDSTEREFCRFPSKQATLFTNQYEADNFIHSFLSPHTNIEGTYIAVIGLFINKSGAIEEVRLLRATPDFHELDSVALSIASSIVPTTPAVHNGKSVDFYDVIIIELGNRTKLVF